MTRRAMATVVSLCAACGELIEAADDYSSEDGYWEPPVVGGNIGGDIITSVRLIAPPSNSELPCYEVKLDTRVKPHCQAAVT